MSAFKKIAGLVAGASAVAIVGVAVAQGVPPNPFISNPALGAGQQSTHLTSMGETGVPGLIDRVATAEVRTEERAAVIEQPAQVAQAEQQQETQAMGAPPAAPEAAPAPIKKAKKDRN
jgi:hypothetical protein